MKNHFIFGYSGNKRMECEKIYNLLDENKILDNKEYIIEPFCGTSAISFYISMKHPKKYKYILNDNNKYLIELYKILSDDEQLKKFIEKINMLCFNDKNIREDNFINKDEYLTLIKNDDLYGWFISSKYYNIRPGLYIGEKKAKKINYEDIIKLGIVKFLREEDIKFYNIEGIEIIKKYEDDKNLLILDPPYLQCNNTFYLEPGLNIYEYLYYNKIKNMIAILNKFWLNDIIFSKYKKLSYEKLYQSRKIKTIHNIYYN